MKESEHFSRTVVDIMQPPGGPWAAARNLRNPTAAGAYYAEYIETSIYLYG